MEIRRSAPSGPEASTPGLEISQAGPAASRTGLKASEAPRVVVEQDLTASKPFPAVSEHFQASSEHLHGSWDLPDEASDPRKRIRINQNHKNHKNDPIYLEMG